MRDKAASCLYLRQNQIYGKGAEALTLIQKTHKMTYGEKIGYIRNGMLRITDEKIYFKLLMDPDRGLDGGG